MKLSATCFRLISFHYNRLDCCKNDNSPSITPVDAKIKSFAFFIFWSIPVLIFAVGAGLVERCFCSLKKNSTLLNAHELSTLKPSLFPILPPANLINKNLNLNKLSFDSSIVDKHQPMGFQETSDKTAVCLESVRNAGGDINKIRMLLKGNVKACHSLFKQAEKEEDVVTQIQLSHALFGMKWGKDDTKDFSSLTIGDLETFSYYPNEFMLFNSAYDQAMEVTSGWEKRENRGTETFRLAASRGYLPAFLELTCKEWNWRKSSFGFAVQLRPFVGKGDKRLDYYFGQALKNGCPIGSALYYEGLYWMNQSNNITVKYPREHQSFEDFKDYYIKYESWEALYNYDGFLVGSSVVLAPSKEAWEAFVKEKLEDIKIAPIDSYLFEYDSKQIKSLLNKYKITADTTSFSEKHKKEVIYSLSLYQDHKEIGKISVREGKIYETFENLEIKPIIEFIENVMKRSGSANSANIWLRYLIEVYKI